MLLLNTKYGDILADNALVLDAHIGAAQNDRFPVIFVADSYSRILHWFEDKNDALFFCYHIRAKIRHLLCSTPQRIRECIDFEQLCTDAMTAVIEGKDVG